MHREENVDIPERLANFVEAFKELNGNYDIPVICSVHPRTRKRLKEQGLSMDTGGVRAMEPLGLFDFVNLEKNARCILSDSGTVQEECCIFCVPNVTIRDVTERPETVEHGSNMLSGADSESILRSVQTVLTCETNWFPPKEYLIENVSHTVVKVVLGHKWR